MREKKVGPHMYVFLPSNFSVSQPSVSSKTRLQDENISLEESPFTPGIYTICHFVKGLNSTTINDTCVALPMAIIETYLDLC